MKLSFKILLTTILSLGGLLGIQALTHSSSLETYEVKANESQDLSSSPTQNKNEQTDLTSAPTEVTVQQQTNITLDKAKEIALSYVNGTIVKTSQDEDDYEIDVQKDGYIYEIEVHKYSGKITNVEKEKEHTSTISLEKAKQLALSQVNGKIIDVKIESDEYQMTVEKDNIYYEIEIDRQSGTIKDIDRERVQTSSTAIISKDQVKNIALNQINGQVMSIDYDDENQEYEIEIKKDDIEYEITIDAVEGKVLKVEKD